MLLILGLTWVMARKTRTFSCGFVHCCAFSNPRRVSPNINTGCAGMYGKDERAFSSGRSVWSLEVKDKRQLQRAPVVYVELWMGFWEGSLLLAEKLLQDLSFFPRNSLGYFRQKNARNTFEEIVMIFFFFLA